MYQSHWCPLWPSNWPSSRSSSCLATAFAAGPPLPAAFAGVQLLVEVLAAGIAVDVEEAAMAWLGCLLLVEKVGEPLVMSEISCSEEEEAEVEVVDVQAAFLMGRMRVGSFEGWSGCKLEGQSCGP